MATATTAIKLLPTATVAEAFGATFSWEIPVVLAGMSASFYGGAVVGSLFVAEAKDLSCGTDLFDVIQFIKKVKIDSFWNNQIAKYPIVYKVNQPNRASYATIAR